MSRTARGGEAIRASISALLQVVAHFMSCAMQHARLRRHILAAARK
jgi:hypothetical protein